MIYLYLITLVLAVIGLITNDIVPVIAGLFVAGIGSLMQRRKE